MFDLNTFPGIFIKENTKNDSKIWYDKIYNAWILEDKHDSWMGLNTFNNYQIKQLYSSYDLAYGDVICTGLGFGLLPVWLASKSSVNSVTVIEKNHNFIEMFMEANPKIPKINILWGDANQYVSDDKFDCLFLDHYETQSWDQTVAQSKQISKNLPNHKVCWLWALEHFYVSDYYPGNKVSGRYRIDFSEKYDEYRRSIFGGVNLPQLSKEKINEYIYTYNNIFFTDHVVVSPGENNFRLSWAIDNS